MDFVPRFRGLHNLRRNPQSRIDFPMDRFRRRSLADFQNLAVCHRQHHRNHLMRAQLLAQAPPRRVHSPIQEPLLDGHEQVISQDAEKDMRLHAIFELMKNGPLGEQTLHCPERRFYPGEQNIGAPDFIGTQILPIGPQYIAPVQLLGDRLLLLVLRRLCGVACKGSAALIRGGGWAGSLSPNRCRISCCSGSGCV